MAYYKRRFEDKFELFLSSCKLLWQYENSKQALYWMCFASSKSILTDLVKDYSNSNI